MHYHKKIAEFDMIFRFDEFSRDLDDLMATLEHDFRKQDTYLAKDWYKKVILILTKRGAIDGVALKALPQFLKGVTTIISLEVCNIIILILKLILTHHIYYNINNIMWIFFSDGDEGTYNNCSY